MKTMTVDVWVIVNGNEEWEIGVDETDLAERYAENVGDDHAIPRRTIKVTLKVPVPEIVELTGDVPGEGNAELKVA